MKILLIGPQGSGKSTQAELLARYLNVPKISTGDIFRQLSGVKEILNAGKLVDDKTTAEIVKNRLNQEDCENGFIMDGYPRTVEQLKHFDPGFDKVIYLKVPQDEVIKRLMNRGREDDTPDLIKTRLDLYNKQTLPLLDYYQTKRILTEIDGMGDINQIQDEIKKSI